jgi:hypothetical protein
MDISVEQKSSLGLYATPLLHQTSFWSAVKHRQGVATLAFDIKVLGSDVSDGPLLNFYEVDDILILLQEIGNGFTIGYVPLRTGHQARRRPHGDLPRRTLRSAAALCRLDLPAVALRTCPGNHRGPAMPNTIHPKAIGSVPLPQAHKSCV